MRRKPGCGFDDFIHVLEFSNFNICVYKSKTFELLELLDIVGFIVGIVYGPKWPFYSCCDYIGLFGTDFIQVLYLGRAPRTKETLPNFREKCRLTRHSRVIRGLTGSQRTPRFWGVIAWY